MCGIYGMVSPAGRPLQNPGHAVDMRRSLAHRGPDGHGCVSQPHAVVGVNRLRIIDRRSEADQPFSDPSGQVWLAVNGEIYNADDLRRRFPDYSYRSRSDVEPLLPLYLSRGAPGLVELDGMFAVAIWDERTRTLTLARDRAGEKPLFVTERDGEIWFGSEIQALLSRNRPVLSPLAASQVIRLGYSLEPHTMWAGVSSVGAGTIATFSAVGNRVTDFWKWGTSDRIPAFDNPRLEMQELIQDAVRKQLVADTPVGVFTSGGLDSALLTAIAAGHCGAERLRTFTVRFPDRSFDEGRPARDLAAHFGTEHVEAIATESALTDALTTVTTLVAEPITDPAVLPTLILARVARESVGVVLSGEGADELFGGYPTYIGHRLAPLFNRLPGPIRALVRAFIGALPSSHGKVSIEYLLKRFVAGAELPWFERHCAWFGSGLPTGLLGPAGVADGVPEPARASEDLVDDVMRWDYQSYLRCLLLPKIDRATSLVALESRAPYLDAELTLYARCGSGSQHVSGLTTKRFLREVARPWVPPWVLRRRKRGLSVPVSAWLNGGLAKTVDRVLDPARLARQGLLNPGKVSQLVAEHRRGRLALGRGLWTLLVLQLWLEHWMPEATG